MLCNINQVTLWKNHIICFTDAKISYGESTYPGENTRPYPNAIQRRDARDATDSCLVYSVRENNTAYLEQGRQTQEGIVFCEATKSEHRVQLLARL